MIARASAQNPNHTDREAESWLTEGYFFVVVCVVAGNRDSGPFFDCLFKFILHLDLHNKKRGARKI